MASEVMEDHVVVNEHPTTIVPQEEMQKVVLHAPEAAVAGSTIDVSWTGPGYNGDFIGIGRVGKMEQPYLNYVYTNVGNPVDLQLPTEAGDYEIKYFVGQGEKVLVKVPIHLDAP